MDDRKRFQRFMLINLSQSISLIGSGLTDFALFYYILQGIMETSGQISQYTVLYFFMYLPGILVAPFVGTIVDRRNKKYILIASDTIAAVGSLSILLINIGHGLSPFHIYLVVLVKALASAFQAPAFQSGISVLVAPKDYGKAVGLAQVGESINKIVSPLLGGVLFYYTSLEAIIGIDLICYLMALVFILPCKLTEFKKAAEVKSIRFLTDCRMGFQVLGKDRMLISLLILFIFNNFFISFIEILVQPLVYVMNEQSGMLMSNSVALGAVMTCGGVGMMISSIILGIKGVPKKRIVSILILNGCGGLILMLVLWVKSVIFFAIGTLFYFLTIPFILGSNITIWQERVPIEHQGKVFSIRRACVLGIIPISSLLAGWAADGMKNSYEASALLQTVTESVDGVYSLLFFLIGLITVLLSIIFVFNRNLKSNLTNGEETSEMEKKHILVTGGARGIGKGIVSELLSKGYKVSFLYCGSKEAADELVESSTKKGYDVCAYQCDVKEYPLVSQTVKTILSERGDIDGLVNNAGVTMDSSLFLMKMEQWSGVLNTNLNGAFHVTKALITYFMKRKKGAIVNVASIAGMKGMSGQTNYCTSKSGLIGFTKSLAVETAKYGIRVNAVAPGYIKTDMTASINEKVKEQMYQQIPMGREGTVEEIAPIVEVLLSDAASYITGQIISIDGGITA